MRVCVCMCKYLIYSQLYTGVGVEHESAPVCAWTTVLCRYGGAARICTGMRAEHGRWKVCVCGTVSHAYAY